MKTHTPINKKNTFFLITLLLSISLISTNSISYKKPYDSLLEMKEKNNIPIPEGFFNIVGKTGLCVSAKNPNGRLVQQKCGDSDDLLWQTEKYSNGLIIKNKTGRVMDNRGQGRRDGNPTLGYSRNNTPAQVWVIESVHNGNHVHIRNLQRNKCFDDTGRNVVGQGYHIWSCSNGNKNQWFLLKAPTDDFEEFRP